MRLVYCSDKECELLPASQSGEGVRSDNIVTQATGGLIPEAESVSVPISSNTFQNDNIISASTGGLIPEAESKSILFPSVKPKTSKKKHSGSSRQNLVKRLRKVQVGAGRKKVLKRKKVCKKKKSKTTRRR